MDVHVCLFWKIIWPWEMSTGHNSRSMPQLCWQREVIDLTIVVYKYELIPYVGIYI